VGNADHGEFGLGADSARKITMRRFRSGSNEVRGPIRTAVVDDKHFHSLRQVRRSRHPFAGDGASAVKVAEQLVESGSESLGLVERREHEREGLVGHRVAV
jgi:hypothetical protein